MSNGLRTAALPAIAVILVSVVLGVQLAYGGGTYAPREPANPCVARTVTSHSPGIEGLTEQLVLIGLDKAACSLGVTREALTLDLAQHATITDAEINALRKGLLSAVAEMKKAGTLPPVSQLVDQALNYSDLNSFLETLIRAIPDSVVDAALKTDVVLDHVINDLDLRSLLTNVSDPNELNKQIATAVSHAVVQSLADRLRGLL